MTVVFTNGSISRIGARNQSLRKIKAGPATLGYITLGLICVVSVFYLLVLMSAQAEGYKIQQLNSQIKTLADDQRAIELRIAESKSLNNVEEKDNIKSLNMVPVKSVSYVSTGTSVASSR